MITFFILIFFSFVILGCFPSIDEKSRNVFSAVIAAVGIFVISIAAYIINHDDIHRYRTVEINNDTVKVDSLKLYQGKDFLKYDYHWYGLYEIQDGEIVIEPTDSSSSYVETHKFDKSKTNWKWYIPFYPFEYDTIFIKLNKEDYGLLETYKNNILKGKGVL